MDDEKEAIDKERCMSCQYLYIEDLYLFQTYRLCGTKCSIETEEDGKNKEENEDENT